MLSKAFSGQLLRLYGGREIKCIILRHRRTLSCLASNVQMEIVPTNNEVASEEHAVPKSMPKYAASIDPDNYQEQLKRKIEYVTHSFSEFSLPSIDVYESKPIHYRMRTEFTVWHEGDDMYYVMFEHTENKEKRPTRLRVDTFPIASKLINELMAILLEKCKQTPVLRHKLFQANFHTTLSGQAMVTLLYHKKLDDSWIDAAKALRIAFQSAPSLHDGSLPNVIGRSHKQKSMLDADFVIEKMTVNDREYQYKQMEGAFSQPNGGVCQSMLSWASSVTRGLPGDLLELYCGNANFTIPLAANFKKVVATEVSKTSVEAARYNLTVNDVSNVFVARMSSEEFTETWRAKGTRRRLEGLDWDKLQLNTLLVDPPRAGLDPATANLMRDFEHVVYISCNPETLRENLKVVADTHDIARFAVFDQFPYTSHLECGVLLKKRET